MCVLASTLALIGTAVSVGGQVIQGVASYNEGQKNAALIREQAATEQQLTSIEDVRLRDQMRDQIAKQRLQLVGRGVSLDSPQAVLLGQAAAEELSFASQALRSRGSARQAELSAAARAARAKGTLGLLKGTLGAAGTFLSAAPDIWPDLYAGAG